MQYGNDTVSLTYFINNCMHRAGEMMPQKYYMSVRLMRERKVIRVHLRLTTRCDKTYNKFVKSE